MRVCFLLLSRKFISAADRGYIDVICLSMHRGWEKMYVVLTADSLLFYKDQKHAKAVSDLSTMFNICCSLNAMLIYI